MLRTARLPLTLIATAAMCVGHSAQAQSGTRAAGDILPITATRTAHFTTDEGTWMSLDVAPDGKTIVFDMLGDLYTIPITGGEAQHLTSGLAWDVEPRYSPDGKTIAFVSDRDGAPNVWLIDRDGSRPRALTTGRDSRYWGPVWLPDGNAIAVTRLTGSEARPYLYDINGGQGVSLVHANGVRCGSPTVGGGGDIYVATHEPGFVLDGFWAVNRIERETRTLIPLTFPGRQAFRPVASRDGQYLAYITRVDTTTILMLRDLRTNTDRVLAKPVQDDLLWGPQQHIDVFPGYAFTPDSRAVVITAGGKIWRIEVATGTRTLIPFTVHVDQPLGPLAKFDYSDDDSLVTVRQIRWPKVSPDGKRVVFQALNHLWTMALSGGPIQRLTNGPAVEDEPVWSPDGRYIAYVTWDPSSGGDVYRIAADSHCLEQGRCRPENITHHPAFYQKVNYTPDGIRLVVVRGPWQWQILREQYMGAANSLELMWLPSRGGEAHRIIRIAEFEPSPDDRARTEMYGWPHFSSDTGRVYMYSAVDGMISVKLDGSGQQRLFTIQSYAHSAPNEWSRPAFEVLLSPDGRHALTVDQRGVALLTLPVGGSYPETVSLHNGGAASGIPVSEISRLGGDFVGWGRDGRSFYWALGHSLFFYDLDQAAAAKARGQPYEPRQVDVPLRVPRDRPRGTVALTGARLITMKGGEVIEQGTIVVRDNRITAVGPSGSVRVPGDAKVINVSGKTVLPGYVDLHAHVHFARGVHDPQPYYLLALLAYGVTTARDPQTSTADVFDYEDRVATGEIVSPRFLSTGPGIFLSNNIQSLDEARAIARRYAEFYHTGTIKQYESGPRLTRQWLAMAANEYHLTPTNEGNTAKGLTFVLDGYGGMEHGYNLPSPIYRDVVELLAQSGTVYDPTLVAIFGVVGGSYFYRHYNAHGEPKLQRFFPHSELDRKTGGIDNSSTWYRDELYLHPRLARDLAMLVAAGARVVMGSHGDLPGLGAHFELWAIASGGMRPIDVLRVGTLYGADGIGLGKELGSLEVGKLADLQVLDRNPLEDIQNTNSVAMVMKNGRLYDANTLDELWPRPRKLPPPWWWTLDP